MTAQQRSSVIENCMIWCREDRPDDPPMFDFGAEGDGRCVVHLDGYAIVPIEAFSSLEDRARTGFGGWWSRVQHNRRRRAR